MNSTHRINTTPLAWLTYMGEPCVVKSVGLEKCILEFESGERITVDGCDGRLRPIFMTPDWARELNMPAPEDNDDEVEVYHFEKGLIRHNVVSGTWWHGNIRIDYVHEMQVIINLLNKDQYDERKSI